MKLFYDLHVHTNYSYDGFIDAKKVGEYANKIGLNGVAITDHEAFDGFKVARDNNKYKNIEIIPGEEVKSELGDILCLCIKREIVSRRFIDIIDEVVEQNGLIILPHPYKYHDPIIFSYMNSFHGVESINGRADDYSENLKEEVKNYTNLVKTGGSDAHLPWELGNVVTQIEVLEKYNNYSFCEIIKNGKVRPVRRKKLNFFYAKTAYTLSKVKKMFHGGKCVKI